MNTEQASPHTVPPGLHFAPAGDANVERLIELVSVLSGEQRQDIKDISASVNEVKTSVALLSEQGKALTQAAQDVQALRDTSGDHERRIKSLEAEGERRVSGLKAWMVWAGSAAIAVVGELVKKFLHL